MRLLKLDRQIQRQLLSLTDPAEIRYFSERKLKQITCWKTRAEQVVAFKELPGASNVR
ncbi:MAG: hypothetical protein ISS35_10055 [Kiritimatiellae bacterium]|nr:hypothetical protein [Kiritimatiellia bacterium]